MAHFLESPAHLWAETLCNKLVAIFALPPPCAPPGSAAASCATARTPLLMRSCTRATRTMQLLEEEPADLLDAVLAAHPVLQAEQAIGAKLRYFGKWPPNLQVAALRVCLERELRSARTRVDGVRIDCGDESLCEALAAAWPQLPSLRHVKLATQMAPQHCTGSSGTWECARRPRLAAPAMTRCKRDRAGTPAPAQNDAVQRCAMAGVLAALAPGLRSLILHGPYLTAPELAALQESMCQLRGLTELRISLQQWCAPEGAPPLARLAPHMQQLSSLQRLVCSTASMEDLAALATHAPSWPPLTSLCFEDILWDAAQDPDSVTAIATALQALTALRRLHLPTKTILAARQRAPDVREWLRSLTSRLDCDPQGTSASKKLQLDRDGFRLITYTWQTRPVCALGEFADVMAAKASTQRLLMTFSWLHGSVYAAIELSQVLQRLPELRHLDLRGFTLRDEKREPLPLSSALAGALTSLTKLTFLSLAKACREPDAMLLLSPGLCVLSELRVLDLSNNTVGRGAEPLAACMPHLLALEVLHLACCRLECEGLAVLLAALATVTTMRSLDLRQNRAFSRYEFTGQLNDRSRGSELVETCLHGFRRLGWLSVEVGSGGVHDQMI